ncbi:MAG: hypothetical protein OD814_000988 [Candidatus Alkanophagales archaeon MCA70_species_1]|nr:hypothetical protein [Candidatus Alkanophaga volatiphilum]
MNMHRILFCVEGRRRRAYTLCEDVSDALASCYFLEERDDGVGVPPPQLEPVRVLFR